MNHQKRLRAFRNAKLSAQPAGIVRVPVQLGDLRRGDGIRVLVEDYADAFNLAIQQFLMETAGMPLVGTIKLVNFPVAEIESVGVVLDDDDEPTDAGGKPKTSAGKRPSDSRAPSEDATSPSLEYVDPAKRDVALKQARQILEDYRDGHLSHHADIAERIKGSALPLLVQSVVSGVRPKFVSKTDEGDIEWKKLPRLPKVLPTQEQLEITGWIRNMKKEGRGTVHIKLKEVITKGLKGDVMALCRRGTDTVPMGYATDAVRTRMSLFDSTTELLRFKCTAARGFVDGDRFEFQVVSVDLAEDNEATKEKIKAAWLEELYRK